MVQVLHRLVTGGGYEDIVITTEGDGSFDPSCYSDQTLCSMGKCNEAAVWLDVIPLPKPEFATDDNVVYATRTSYPSYSSEAVIIKTVSFEEFKNYVISVQKDTEFSYVDGSSRITNNNIPVQYDNLDELLKEEPTGEVEVRLRDSNYEHRIAVFTWKSDTSLEEDKLISCGVSKSSMSISTELDDRNI